MKEQLERLTPEMIVPPGLIIPWWLTINLDKLEEVEKIVKHEHPYILEKMKNAHLNFNPLTTCVDVESLPQKELDSQFVVHHNWGNEELASMMRIELYSTNERIKDFVKSLILISTVSPDQHLNLADIRKEKSRELTSVITVLIYCGFLM